MVSPETWQSVTTLHTDGRLEEAEARYRAILSQEPRHAESAHMLGMLLHQKGADTEALEWLERALRLAGERPALLVNTARVHIDLENFGPALDLLDQALQWRPEDGVSHLLKFHCLYQMGRARTAVGAYRSACRHGATVSNPVRFQAAKAYQRLGAWVDAIETLDRVIEEESQHVEALVRRGVFKGLLGDTGAALADFRRVLAIDPSYQQVHSNLLIRMQYDPQTTNAALFDAHRQWNDRHANAEPHTPFTNDRDVARPLTIGWISPRFDSGLIACFLPGPLRALTPGDFRHVFYNTRAAAQAIPQELTSLGAWHDVEDLQDSELAGRVAKDGIDILVDLAGHNPGNRLTALATRLAPVQVSWLDYFATTGVTAVDYWLTDAYLSPPGSGRYFTESLVRLPDTRLCYTPMHPQVELSRSKRRPGEIVFGSFNRPGKFSEPVLETWVKIVQSVPDSRLLLKAEELGDARVREWIRQRFRHAGLDDRLLELRPATPYRQMLAEYADIDIALDPFPFTGCATTCDALWMGAPVITLAGETLVSRQGCSILRNVGHPEWVTTERERYAQTARELARAIRNGGFDRAALRADVLASALCDTAAQASALSYFFRQSWTRYCEAKRPSGFDLTRGA